MANPENARVLSEERALFDAESAVAQAELDAWARVEALDQSDLPALAQAALDRVAALEAAGFAAADLPKVRAALQAMLTSPSLAAQSRAAALAARQKATAARSSAAAALSAALGEVEPKKAARKRDVDAIETFVGKWEATVRARQTGAAPRGGA